MSNGIFDQVIVPIRQRPSSTDHNRLQSQLYRTLRAVLRTVLGTRAGHGNVFFPYAAEYQAPAVGFIGDGFRVQASSPVGMSVVVRAGLGFQYDATDVPTDIDAANAVDDREAYKVLALSAPQTIVVPTADASLPRIDIVEAAYDRRAEESTSVDIKAETPPFNFVATAKNKVLAWLQDGRTSVNGAGGSLAKINYKTGTPNASPTAPTATTGYFKIAEVRVDAAAANIAQNKINDTRRLVAPGGVHTVRLRMQVPGTVAGAGANTTLGLVAPPSATVAHAAQLLSGGSEPAVWIACGGDISPNNITIQAYAEEDAATGKGAMVRVASLGIVTLDSALITQITGGTGSTEGLALAVGQKAIQVLLHLYNDAGTLLANPTKVNLEVSFTQGD